MGRGRPGTGVEPLAETIRLSFQWQGKRWRETLGLRPTAANIKAAERLVAQIKQEISAGVFDYARHFPSGRGAGLVHDGSTFAAFATQWLETLTIEHSTKKTYTSSIDNVWKPHLGDLKLLDIRRTDIQAIVAKRRNGAPAELDAAGKEIRPAVRKVSAKTINNDLIPLRAVFEAAGADDLLEASPAAKIKNLLHQSPQPDPFTIEEREKILCDLRDRAPVPAWAYFEFAFATGMRPSEMIVLTWGDIDWNAGTARVSKAKTRGQEKDTKTHTVRDVDLTPRAVAALKAMKPFTFMKGDATPVFCHPATGEPWTNDQYQRVTYFHPALRRLGIRSRDAYQCRHTYATLALMAGVNPAYIARQMGHKTMVMLLSRYAKWIDQADKGREARKLAAALDGEFAHDLSTGSAK